MLAFRVNASSKIGFGHLKRCAYLANLVKTRIPVVFYINKDQKARKFLAQMNIDSEFTEELNSIDQVCRNIIFDLKSFSPADLNFLKQAKTQNLYILQITDLGIGQQQVNCIIDSAVKSMVPFIKGPDILSGPDYAILHHKFIHFNQAKRIYNRKIKNLFICLGGGVDYRILRDTTDLFHRFGFNLKIAPGYYLKKSGQKTLKRIYKNLSFVGKTDNLARSFYKCDLAIISPGVAAFEAAATGTPALYCSHDKDQEFVAASFENQGLGKNIGPVSELTNKNVIEIINSMDLKARAETGFTGKNLIDGKGVYRVIEQLKRVKVF